MLKLPMKICRHSNKNVMLWDSVFRFFVKQALHIRDFNEPTSSTIDETFLIKYVRLWIFNPLSAWEFLTTSKVIGSITVIQAWGSSSWKYSRIHIRKKLLTHTLTRFARILNISGVLFRSLSQCFTLSLDGRSPGVNFPLSLRAF